MSLADRECEGEERKQEKRKLNKKQQRMKRKSRRRYRKHKLCASVYRSVGKISEAVGGRSETQFGRDGPCGSLSVLAWLGLFFPAHKVRWSLKHDKEGNWQNGKERENERIQIVWIAMICYLAPFTGNGTLALHCRVGICSVATSDLRETWRDIILPRG